MLVLSHRGPVSFRATEQGFESRRGAGGVVSALGPLLANRADVRWIAAAISDDDRAAVAAGAAAVPGFDLDLLALDPTAHRLHYEQISNRTLWFLLHGIFDRPRRPSFDRRFREAWEGYVAVNRAFADAALAVAPERATVLVQDLHLLLVPGMLRHARPDLRISLFVHTPSWGPGSLRLLPEYVAHALTASLGQAPVGFHTRRWASAYVAASIELFGPDEPPAFVASFGPDVAALERDARSAAVAERRAELDELVGDRQLVVRSDRMELSKNIVRGFEAFDLLLDEHPELRGRVVFAALLNPSRGGLPEYQAYRNEVEQAAARINERWGRADWEPVHLDTRDDFARSVAGFARADALLVNPIKDGLNLVAKEAPLVNERSAPLCLSREAGAYEELHGACIAVHPYDIVQTAAALHEALAMPADERAQRAARLRAIAGQPTPRSWLEHLTAAAR